MLVPCRPQFSLHFLARFDRTMIEYAKKQGMSYLSLLGHPVLAVYEMMSTFSVLLGFRQLRSETVTVEIHLALVLIPVH